MVLPLPLLSSPGGGNHKAAFLGCSFSLCTCYHFALFSGNTIFPYIVMQTTVKFIFHLTTLVHTLSTLCLINIRRWLCPLESREVAGTTGSKLLTLPVWTFALWPHMRNPLSVIIKILLFVLKSFNGCAPFCLCELLHPYIPPHCLRSAEQMLLLVSKTQLKLRRDRALKLWLKNCGFTCWFAIWFKNTLLFPGL